MASVGFNLLDVNKDGVIELEELQQVYTVKVGEKEVVLACAEEEFGLMDSNKNGKVDQQELREHTEVHHDQDHHHLHRYLST